MGLFSKKEEIDRSGPTAIARTVVEVPEKCQLDYLRKVCTFRIRKAEVDGENCHVYFSCEQDVPWSKHTSEAYMTINLPHDYIHLVHAHIQSGVRVRMIIEPISEDEPEPGMD